MVLAAQEVGLDVLGGERPTAVRTFDLAGTLDVTEAELDQAIRVRLPAVQVEIVAAGLVRLINGVLAEKGIAEGVLAVAQRVVLDAAAQTRGIPVVEVVKVDVVALVIASARPYRSDFEYNG